MQGVSRRNDAKRVALWGDPVHCVGLQQAIWRIQLTQRFISRAQCKQCLAAAHRGLRLL